MEAIATTVGRIEYIVGADGSVLTKESRDVARKAGQKGGDTYSDEFTKELRKKWGGASGFAATLGKYDKQVIRQFQELGGFTSKAYVTRFEKTLRPAYQSVAKRMISFFESLKFDPLNGATAELQRIFRGTQDVEGGMRKLKDVLDEIEATSRMGIIDRKSFDIGAVNQLREALQKVFDTQNYELLTANQLKARDALREQAEAAAEIARVEKIRQDYVAAQLTPEMQRTRAIQQQQSAIQAMLRDREQDLDITRAQVDEHDRLAKTTLMWQKAAAAVGDEMHRVNRETTITYDGFKRFQNFDVLDAIKWAISDMDTALRGANLRLGRFTRELDDAERSAGLLSQTILTRFNNAIMAPWQSLDNDVRLVIGLIASAAGSIAVLGSAVGAGLFGLGAAAAAAAGGVIGLVVPLVQLSKSLEDLPPDLRAAAQAFDRLKSSFSDLATEMTRGFVEGSGRAFDDLARTVSTLVPEFRSLSRVAGQVFEDFAAGIRPGTEAFGEITTLLENAGELFPPLARAAGTWGTAIVRALNGAEPLARDLVEWIQELGSEFDRFTRSASFAEWVSNAQTVFGALGGLLDSLGQALNDLATPEAVANTVEFLNDLSRFIPVLGEILNIVSVANPLGILADALADLGDIITPLLPLFEDLARAFATLADFASPAIGVGIVAITTALLSFRAANALGGLAAQLQDATGWMGQLGQQAGKGQNAFMRLTGALGKIGIIATAAAAFVGLTDAIKEYARAATDVEGKSRELVATNADISQSYKTLNTDLQGNLLVPTLKNGAEAVDMIGEKAPGLAGIFSNLGRAFNDVGQQSLALEGTLTELDAPLADLADQSLPKAQEAFQGIVKDLGLSDEQAQIVLNTMPQLKAAFEEAAGGTDGLATSQETLNYALGQGAAGATDATGSISLLGDTAVMTKDQVNDLADAIRNFGDTQISTMEANAAFEQSLDDLVITTGEGTTALDLNTQAGRDNQASLLDSIKAINDQAAATLDQTGSTEQANAVLATSKQRLIDQIKAFDDAGYEAGVYTDLLDQIPDDVETVIKADTTQASKGVQTFISQYNGKTITLNVDGVYRIKGAPVGFQAEGGAIRGPGTGTSDTAGLYALSNGEHVLTAKEVKALGGQDAVYAFRRALMGGKAPAAASGAGMATGGAVGAPMSRVVNVSEGAIQINGSTNPQAAAVNVLNRLVERIS